MFESNEGVDKPIRHRVLIKGVIDIIEIKQAVDKAINNNANPTTTQSYRVPTGTNLDDGEVSPSEYGNPTTTQFYPSEAHIEAGVPTDANTPTITPQPDVHVLKKESNLTLNKALLGGLVGLTLGSLAAVWASKIIRQRVNQSLKGQGDASKTIGDGVGQTVKGQEDVAKTIAEDTMQAVVGGAMNTAENVAEATKQTRQNTLHEVKSTADDVNQGVEVNGDKVNDIAWNSRPSDNQGNQYQEEISTINPPINNDEIGRENVDQTSWAYISNAD